MKPLDTSRMFRVLATHWEAEAYTECWCADRDSAETIARLLRANASFDDTSVQIDNPQRSA